MPSLFSASSATARTEELGLWSRVILTIYLVASIPMRVAFYPDFQPIIAQYPGYVILDLLATLFFSYELICLARHTLSLLSPKSVLPEYEPVKDDSVRQQSYEVEAGDTKQARTIYSYGRLLFYFVSTFPLEYLPLLFSSGGDSSSATGTFFLMNRLLRGLSLPKYLRNLSTVLGRRGYLTNIGVQRTWLLFFTMALAGHLCGCGFFLVARHQALNGLSLTWPEVSGIYSISSATTVEGQQQQVALTMESTAAEAYIKSLYWAYITMITTGFGDIVPLHINETLWCIFSMFVGVLITALTIANLQRTIGQFDAARLSFQRKMEMIRKFMNYRSLPKDIQERVMSFYDYQWKVLRGADEEQFLMELPRTLQQQVTNYMCRDIISSLPLLRRANGALLNVSNHFNVLIREHLFVVKPLIFVHFSTPCFRLL